MDYPKSLPGVGLVGGKFADADPVSGTPGSWIAAAWGNGFMDELLHMIVQAGLTPDEATLNQLYTADKILARKAVFATFAEIDALTSDQGPIICTNMGESDHYQWMTSPYFTGYRSVRCGTMPTTFAASPRPGEIALIGGVLSESDPKHKRLIAWFREQGLVIAAGSWKKGDGYIADLGSGNWKAPDIRDGFPRWAGTDADTANPRLVGSYQADAFQGSWPLVTLDGTVIDSMRSKGVANNLSTISGGDAGTAGSNFAKTAPVSDGVHGTPRVSSETRGASTAVAPVILV